MLSLTPELGTLLFLQHLEGALQLGILREDLFPRKVFGLVRGAWLLVLPQLHLDVRLDAGPPNRVPVRGQPLGYGEQHGRAVAQGVLVEHGPVPKVVSPTTSARPLSRKAPAMISALEEDPLSTRTTRGASRGSLPSGTVVSSSPLASLLT